MSKNLKKIVVLMFAIVLAVSSFVGCTPDPTPTPSGSTSPSVGPTGSVNPGLSGQLDIVVAQLGYGTEQIEKIAEEFGRIYGVTVDVRPTVVQSAEISQLEAGGKLGDLCLFTDSSLWNLWREGIAINIDDVVNSTPDGESKTVKQKMRQDIAFTYQYPVDGSYYSIPWSMDNMGLLYNETALNTIFGENNWEMPVTTNEMLQMAKDIKAEMAANPGSNYYLMVYGALDSYWQILYKQWWAQYQGLEAYTQACLGYYWDEATQTYKFSQNAECVEQQVGLARSYDFIQQLIRNANGYSHPFSRNMDFINSQAAWLGNPYNGMMASCVFMPNGDWVFQESGEDIEYYNQTIGFAKTPILSAIVETLSFYEHGSAKLTSLNANIQNTYDATLKAIIEYVDGGKVGAVPQYKGTDVTPADIARIEEARSTIGSKSQCQMFIPYNADDVELAKQFMIFYASSYASNIYSEYSYAFSPFYQEGDNVRDHYFMNQVKEILHDCPRYIMEFQSYELANKIDWDKMGDPAEYFQTDTDNLGRTKSGDLALQIAVDHMKLYWREIVVNAGLGNLLED